MSTGQKSGAGRGAGDRRVVQGREQGQKSDVEREQRQKSGTETGVGVGDRRVVLGRERGTETHSQTVESLVNTYRLS